MKITDNHNQQSNNNDKYESVNFFKKVMICHEKNKREWESSSTLKNASFFTSSTNKRNLYAYLVLWSLGMEFNIELGFQGTFMF